MGEPFGQCTRTSAGGSAMSRTRRLMPYTWNTTGSVINGSGFLGFLRHGAHLALIKPGAVWAASATPGYRIFNTKSRGIHNGFRAWTDAVAGIWMVCRPGAGQSGTPKHQHPRRASTVPVA